MRRFTALLALTAALGGCGGSSLDRSSVTAVTRHYFAAIADGNGREACTLLSASAKQTLGRSAKAAGPYAPKAPALDCVKQVRAVRSLFSPQARAGMRNVALGKPAVAGRSATIRAVTGSRTSNVRLVMTSNGWVIDSVGAQPSPPVNAGSGAESQATLEHQIDSGEVKSATVDKRVRSVRLTLTDGKTVLARYDAPQQAKILAALEEKAAYVQVLSAVGAPSGSG